MLPRGSRMAEGRWPWRSLLVTPPCCSCCWITAPAKRRFLSRMRCWLGAPTVLTCCIKLAEPSDVNGALNAAVRVGDLRATNILLERGAQPAPNFLQSLALAPKTIPLDTIQMLIGRGANIHFKTSTGVPILEFAKRQGNTTLVDALSQAGVSDERPCSAPAEPQAVRLCSRRA